MSLYGALRIPALSVLALVLAGASQTSSSPVQHISIVGTDYAFQMPPHIKAGATTFTFANKGTVRHEMTIVELSQGVSGDSALKAIVAGQRRRELTDGQAALLIGSPTDAPGPEIWIDLKKGRSYILLCNLKNTPESPAHVTLGMFASFTAE